MTRLAINSFVVSVVLMAACSPLFAQDILMADFEESNYVWLPGGTWTVTGTAFGSGPAQGALAGQSTVTGYLGNGLVNTYLGGDVSTGTLTSPPFTIQRKYIKFLIGGGNHRGQTSINLLVGGQVVLSAVGTGDRETLNWLQWNVNNYSNQTAQLQIVDAYTAGWGHINVDQITQTDTSLSCVFTAAQHYLNLPVRYSQTDHLVELLQNGLVVHEFNIGLVTSGTPDYYAFLDLTAFQGETLVRVDSQLANSAQMAAMIQSSTIIASMPIYQETIRPIYHYTARRGYINDPNGLVYYNGEYHLCYQHNPYGVVVGNQHWGNAVSTDLVHWQELPEALYPDWRGQAWSGSSVVDSNNSAGYGPNAIVSVYTVAGGHGNNPRMSLGQVFTQCEAYSLDSDRTFIKYTNNPVVPNVQGDNRDPKIIWYAPGNKWVMSLWLTNNSFGFFSSTNLKNWTQTSTFTFPGVIEVPELFQLPLDDNTSNMKWIFWGGAGHYYVGQFDGNQFTAQNGPYVIRQGNSMAAAQTFNNIPASDGRRILISQGTENFPNMPFNSIMNFPVVLTLQSTVSGPWLYANPVNEIALLRTSTTTWPAQALVNGVNVMSGTTGVAYEMDAQFQPGTASQITFNLAGTQVIYSCGSQQVTCGGLTSALSPSNGIVELRFLVDIGSLEIFGNGGLLYMPMSVTPTAGSQSVSLVASGNGAQLVSLNIYNLGSAWTNSSAPATPMITQAPTPVTVVLGGPATFSVTATGGPLTYQWLSSGEPILGATNSTFSIFPATGTNVSYSVVVANSGGAVTSGVASLTLVPPYEVAYWRMESQVQTPNTMGVPSYTGAADSDTNSGQGIYTTGALPASIDDLITFNGLSGNPVTLSTNVAPVGMLVNSHSAGGFSYNAEAIASVDGVLFFPQDQYGDEMDFIGPFSIEIFFKTDGNQNGAGIMQLISQGTDSGQMFRYGIDVNEAAAGAVRFAVANSSLGQTKVVDLTGTNYADGQWHYLLAVCDTMSGLNGQLRLTIANQDGSQASTISNLPSGFLPLPAHDNGNMFIGRYTYPVSQTPRTFLGFIDEVQITAGVLPDTWRVGKIPSIDNNPQINGISMGTNGVSFQWTGASVSNFNVQWVSQLGAAWQTIATLPSANAGASFVDTNAARLTNSAGFYRIDSQ